MPMNDGKLDTSKSLASAPASRTGGLGSILLGVRLAAALPAAAAVAATLPISCDWGLTGCVDPVDLVRGRRIKWRRRTDNGAGAL